MAIPGYANQLWDSGSLGTIVSKSIIILFNFVVRRFCEIVAPRFGNPPINLFRLSEHCYDIAEVANFTAVNAKPLQRVPMTPSLLAMSHFTKDDPTLSSSNSSYHRNWHATP